jgi:ribosomal RNA-processing protein 1
MTAAMVTNSVNGKVEKTVITKRQSRRAGPNATNTLPQQPKIKSQNARAKAYLRHAGFTSSSAKSPKKVINPEADFINSAEYKFGRLLASPVARTRHATILKLKEYLKARTDPSNENGGLSILDLMKLWKGMWHTLYLCDGVVVQEEVSKVLAELIWSVGGNQEEDEYAGRFYLEMEEGVESDNADGCCDEEGNCSNDLHDADVEEGDDDDDDDEMQIIEMQESDEEESSNDDEEDGLVNPVEEEDVKHCRGAHLSALYVRTFFRTLTREWSNMDKYRIDKFYTLSRLIVREIYRYMASRHWNLGIIRLFNDAIFEEVLRANKYGNGVRFHMLDICLEELAKVNSEEVSGLPLTEATFLDALEPYFALAQRVDDKMVQQKVMDRVILRFLEEFSVASDNYGEIEEEDEEAIARKNLVMDEVHVGTVGQFIFELASDTETADRYRKGLYDMHKTYMKRVKAVGRDVVMADDDEEEDDTAVEDAEALMELDEENADVEEEAPVELEEEEPEPEPKKSKKKKKKTKDKSSSLDKVEEEDSAPKKDKASKKKKRKAKDAAVEESISEHEEKDLVTPTKKRKKDKSARKEMIAQPEIELSQEEEEIISISMKEQKAAAKAVMKAAKAAKAKLVRKVEPPSSSKRVQFGKMNQSKSYKASMKDLKKIDAKAILVKTPEKSILHKKSTRDGKKKRKKSSK